MNKKAISGISIMIILIASILIAVISSIFLLETSFLFEQKSHDTAKKTSNHLSNKIFIDEVSSEFRDDGTLLDFALIVQLLPSSERINFDSLELMVQTPNESIVISYRENGIPVKGNTGFKTLRTEEIGAFNTTHPFVLGSDLDDDRIDDQVAIDNNGLVKVEYSGGGSYTIPQLACSGPVLPKYRSVNPGDGFTGHILFDGSCGNLRVTESVDFVLTPEKRGRGYYAIQYLQQSENHHLEGRLSNGDIAKIFFEMIEPLPVDTPITIVLTPADGNPTEKRIIIPSYAHLGKIFFD